MNEILPQVNEESSDSPGNIESRGHIIKRNALNYYKQLAIYFDSRDEVNTGRFLKAYNDLLEAGSRTLTEVEIDAFVKKIIIVKNHIQSLQRLRLADQLPGSLRFALNNVAASYSIITGIDEAMEEEAKDTLEQNKSSNTRFVDRSDPDKIMRDYTSFSIYGSSIDLANMLGVLDGIQNRFLLAINEFAELSQKEAGVFDFDQTLLHLKAILFTNPVNLSISKRKELNSVVADIADAICRQDFSVSKEYLGEITKLLPGLIGQVALNELGITQQ